MPGPKPRLAEFKLIEGNPGKERIALPAVDEKGMRLPPIVADNGLRPVQELAKRQMELWKMFIQRAPWLGLHDIPRAHMWVELHAEFEKNPKKMPVGRICQLRALGSELGFDPLSRSRMGNMAISKKSKFDGLITQF